MCALNPTHKKRLILDVFTSQQMDKEEFDKKVLEAALQAEIRLNEDCFLRWHLKEKTD